MKYEITRNAEKHIAFLSYLLEISIYSVQERDPINRGQLGDYLVRRNKIEEAAYRMRKSPLPAFCVTNHCRPEGNCS